MYLALLKTFSTFAIVGIVLIESKKIDELAMGLFVIMTCVIYGIACRYNENIIIIQATTYGILFVITNTIPSIYKKIIKNTNNDYTKNKEI